MLGHRMVQRLSASFPDTWWTLRGSQDDGDLTPAPWLRGSHALEHIDATDVDALEQCIKDLRPDVVVNCLGIIKQRAASHDAIPSLTINGLLPHRLASLIGRWGGRLVHFSTDCVFSGKRGNYTESDFPDAEDLYGRTKFLGEVGCGNALTLRTSMIGRELRHHGSLLDWFLSHRGTMVRGYRRHRWSGVTTHQLADVTARAITEWPTLTGVYHLSSGCINKYELLLLLREGLDVDVEIEPDDLPVCDRSLVGDRLEAATGYRCPPWPAMIAELAGDPTQYPDVAA
jgi:dTDP-4-dehydrorhamnose reductase